MNTTRDAEIHHLIAGELCLDFANTLYGHGDAPIHEYLFDYRDLALWARHVEILTDKETRGLLKESENRLKEANAVFRNAITLREQIYRIFAGLAHGTSPQADDVAALHAAWLSAMNHSSLTGTVNGYRLNWAAESSLDRMLWPIVDSAIKLLTSEEMKQVKQCGSCDWLFVDRSRNHLRRWCSMDQCGNRAKMRRRYARIKQANK